MAYQRVAQKLTAAEINLSAELEHWFNTRGKELERTFISALCTGMNEAQRREISYSRINVAGIMDYFHQNKNGA